MEVFQTCHKSNVGNKPFHVPTDLALPWAVVSGHFAHMAMERALSWPAEKSTEASKIFDHPLLKHYLMWQSLFHMSKWMEKCTWRGDILQFASPPPSFNRVLELVISQAETAALRIEMTELMEKGAIS